MEHSTTMDLVETLRLLADQNRSGVAFLAAYGLTWSVCGVVWLRAPERVAAVVTLVQGLVAFPVALGLSAAIGAIGEARPVADEITQLSVLIGTSQLLGLPFVILLVVRKLYALVPVAFAGITSMHFVLYSWLYRTPVYLVMAVVISLGATTLMARNPDSERGARPAAVCFLTATALLVSGLVLLLQG